MPRQKKDYRPMSLHLDMSIYERLCAFCEESGQSKTTAIERAITAYVDNYEKVKAKIEESK